MTKIPKTWRLGFIQFASAVLLILAVHSGLKYFVNGVAFAPGFFIYAPGGESLAYTEFQQARGRKVAFIGNSVMAALDFPRLSNVVKRHYGDDIQVFNFGRPAQGVGDYRVILARLKDLKPDFIVMQIHEISIAGQIFRTNVRGQIAYPDVLRRVGPDLFFKAYGMEGFFQSPLYRLPLYPYRDPFRQTQLQRSVYFGSTLKDLRSQFWRHTFQGSDPFLGTPQDARTKPQEQAVPGPETIGDYGIELDEVQVRLFEEMLEDLKATGIPYFVYLQPVPPTMARAATGDFFRNKLREHGIEFTDIRNDYPEDLFTTMRVHMRDSRHIFDLLFSTRNERIHTWKVSTAQEAGFCTDVRSSFDLRNVDEFGMFKQLNIEGELKRRDYFLFHDQNLIRIRPGSPIKIENAVLADFAAGIPIAIADEMHFWAPGRIMDKLRAVHLRKCNAPHFDPRMQNLRFVSLSVPADQASALFQISVNGLAIAELGSMEAEANQGYWHVDRLTSTVTLILPPGDPIREIQAVYIARERTLGNRLKGL